MAMEDPGTMSDATELAGEIRRLNRTLRLLAAALALFAAAVTAAIVLDALD